MRRAAWKMGLALATLYAVGGCGSDEAVTFGTGGSEVAADAQPDAGIMASGGAGGSTGVQDSSAEIASEAAQVVPDVASSDAPGEAADDRTLDESSEEASADATSEVPGDAAGETVAEAGPSDDAIADGAEAGPPVSKICALGCQTTDDCRADASNSKLVCDPLNHRCVACVDDLSCIAGVSQWTVPCSIDTDCTIYGDYCIDVGGPGACAYAAAKIGTLSCSGNASTYAAKKHGSSDTVSVCAKLTNTCDLRRGRCEGPCTITCTGDGSTCTSTCTASRGGKVCNATTRRCECASNDDCASPISHCNLATQQCECASGSDCAPDGGSALVCR